MAQISQIEELKKLNSSYFYFRICGQNQPTNSGPTALFVKPVLQSKSREIQQKRGLTGLNRIIPA
jgi:hypothetical protein